MADLALGMRLRMAREKAGLKQAEICEEMGIQKVQTLSAYERGVNNPPIEVLKELSLRYGVSIDSLVFGESALPTPKRTTEEYVRLLVEAAVHLNLDFITREETYSGVRNHYLDLNAIGFENFDSFVDKWSALRSLVENGTLSLAEYESVLMQRLSSLKLNPVHMTPEE